MRENLSAPGTVSDWLKITRQAFQNLNYYNITRDKQYARVSARYGYDDYIVVNIRSKDRNHVLLEFDVSNRNMINQFKTAATQIIRKIRNEKRQQQQDLEYGPVPVENVNYEEAAQVYTTQDVTPDKYVAEEGDFIEQTRILPDDTLRLKQFRKDQDKLEEDSIKHKFKNTFDKLWLIWLMLIVLPPFGIFLLWYFKRMSIFSRIILSALSFLYFFLIWIGFFGIDTGFNRDSIQKFYNTQQNNTQRYLENFNPGTDPNQAIESVTPEEETPAYPEPGLVQQNTDTAQNDFNYIFGGISNFFKNIFGGSAP